MNKLRLYITILFGKTKVQIFLGILFFCYEIMCFLFVFT